MRSGTTRALCRTMSKSIAARSGIGEPQPLSRWTARPSRSHRMRSPLAPWISLGSGFSSQSACCWAPCHGLRRCLSVT